MNAIDRFLKDDHGAGVSRACEYLRSRHKDHVALCSAMHFHLLPEGHGRFTCDIYGHTIRTYDDDGYIAVNGGGTYYFERIEQALAFILATNW